MASKSELKRQKLAAAKKVREREQKRARSENRKAVREARQEVAPSAPMWRRAGQWLGQLGHVAPAIANDEILLTLCKTSMLLRGMYKNKPTTEVAVALTVIDTLGTGLTGAEIPDSWDLVSKETVNQDANGGTDQHGTDTAQSRDDGQPALSSAETAVERGVVGSETLQERGVPGELGDVSGQGVEPVLDSVE